ncbi:MAG: helix-turn-helix transcriptional regulator [Erysipelotrichia bacterium]|jgi:DNA-binding HxlR family transcriptional regulator|nr:helix-turn-helix transcriptional regulator [Erysipelotrichia bacterium]
MSELTLCPKYEHVFKWLGKRWNGLILRCLSNQPLKFTQISTCLKTCSDKVLTQRLKELQDEGIVEHIDSYYQLSEKGHALKEVLEAVQHFADQHTTP